MRRKRHKATRRALRFFRINHGFKEPYKVLLDGNFVHALRETSLGPASEVIPKLLGARARVLTTRCVLEELRAMGPEFRSTAIAARKGAALHYCGHGGDSGGGDGSWRRESGGGGKGTSGNGTSKPNEPCLPAAACLATCVGPASNAEHFIVATQDRALRAALGEAPAGAAIFLTAGGLQFELPTEAQRRHAAAVGAADRGALPGERAFPVSKKSSSAAGGAEGDAGEGAGGRLAGTEALEEVARAARRAWARDTAVAFRRNRAKGPNPLSVKKKKKHEAPTTGAASAALAPRGPKPTTKEEKDEATKKTEADRSSPKERGSDEGPPLARKVRLRQRRKKRSAAEGGGE